MDAILGSDAAKLAVAGDIQEGAIVSIVDYVVNVINDAQKLVITGEFLPCPYPSQSLSLAALKVNAGLPMARKCPKCSSSVYLVQAAFQLSLWRSIAFSIITPQASLAATEGMALACYHNDGADACVQAVLSLRPAKPQWRSKPRMGLSP